MSRLAPLWTALLLFVLTANAPAEDPVFSGPQVGETLPSFKAKGVFGDSAGKEFDFIEQAKGKSVALIFVHARTRPAFGLTNTIMKFAAGKKKDGLESGVIFLTDDPTETAKWMNVVEQNFPKGITYGISTDGPEGPGAYGLNRNVTLTVLIGKAGKVTANYALVQPSLPQDGPKILKAIVDVTGGGEVPSIESLADPGYQNRQRMERNPAAGRPNDEKLVSLLRAVINKDATDEDVKAAAEAVEKYIAENETARRDLAQRINLIVNSDKLSNYGNKTAQEILTRWAKKYEADREKTPVKPQEIKP
ncbi:MAG TPA: hypothetical protein VLA12_10125 [Planctomycetaceae bacterium]|nr:hypothetical protein [Planctomycetaceae bacterium]